MSRPSSCASCRVPSNPIWRVTAVAERNCCCVGRRHHFRGFSTPDADLRRQTTVLKDCFPFMRENTGPDTPPSATPRQDRIAAPDHHEPGQCRIQGPIADGRRVQRLVDGHRRSGRFPRLLWSMPAISTRTPPSRIQHTGRLIRLATCALIAPTGKAPADALLKDPNLQIDECELPESVQRMAGSCLRRRRCGMGR